MANFNRKKFKLTFDKERTQFIVNENKRTVSCITIAEIVAPYAWDSSVHIPREIFKVVGTARCTADDKFDAERGRRIALAKAENKAYMKAAEYLSKRQEDIIFMDNAITEFRKKAYGQCGHNKDYIESLSNPEHPRYKRKIKKTKRRSTLKEKFAKIFM